MRSRSRRLIPSLLAPWLLFACEGADRPPAGGDSDRARAAAAERATVEDRWGEALPDSASLMGLETTPAAAPPAADEAALATQVIEDYYAAIDVGDYQRAFALWGDRGRSSGQTYLEFVAGFARTSGVSVSIGRPGRVEGAAGSRFIDIPVAVEAVGEGRVTRYEGSYTLRRVLVDGATPEQRRWHLHDANLIWVGRRPGG